MKYSLQDLAATIVSIVIVCAIAVLAAFDKVVPDALMTGMGSAITWLFIRSAVTGERSENGHHL